MAPMKNEEEWAELNETLEKDNEHEQEDTDDFVTIGKGGKPFSFSNPPHRSGDFSNLTQHERVIHQLMSVDAQLGTMNVKLEHGNTDGKHGNGDQKAAQGGVKRF